MNQKTLLHHSYVNNEDLGDPRHPTPKSWSKVSETKKLTCFRVPTPTNRKLKPAAQLTEDEQSDLYIAHCLYHKQQLPTLAAAKSFELRGMAESALAHLVNRARDGDGKALWQFTELTIKLCETLREMTEINPESLRPIARHQSRWPMMRSSHPLQCDPDTWLEAIELGRAEPIQLDKFSKWKPGWAATYAMQLFFHIQRIREEDGFLITDKGDVKFSDWIPAFTKDSAPQWWELAWSFLLATYPYPEQVEELDRLAVGAAKRKSPGRRKQAIHDKLKARFLAIATS